MGKIREASTARLNAAKIQLAGALGIRPSSLIIGKKYCGLCLFLVEGKTHTRLTPALTEDSLLAWLEGCTFGVHFDHGDVEIFPNRNPQLSLLRK